MVSYCANVTGRCYGVWAGKIPFALISTGGFDHHWVKPADFTLVEQILATVAEHTTRPWRNRWHPVSMEVTKIVRVNARVERSMVRTQKAAEQLIALAGHLVARRSAILQAWRESVQADPELTVVTALPRTQFNDHIPQVLDSFERKLRLWSRPGERRSARAAKRGLCHPRLAALAAGLPPARSDP